MAIANTKSTILLSGYSVACKSGRCDRKNNRIGKPVTDSVVGPKLISTKASPEPSSKCSVIRVNNIKKLNTF